MLEDGHDNIIKFIPKRYSGSSGDVGEGGGIIIDFIEGKRRVETYREIEKMYITEKGVTAEEMVAEYNKNGLDLKRVLNKMTEFVLGEFKTEDEMNLKLYQFIVSLSRDEFLDKGILAMNINFFTGTIVDTLKKFLEIKKTK